MKKLIYCFAGIMALLSIVGLEACQTAKTSTATKMLKFNLEKGKGYDYELTTNMDQEIMGQPMKMDMVMYYSMDVSGEDEGAKTIIASFERFKMKTEVAGFNLDVDTDKPLPAESGDSNDDPFKAINKVFSAVKGQKFTMKVNAEGKITDVQGFETMAASIADSLSLDTEEREKLMKEFKGLFNAEEIKQGLERYWYIFPNKEVKVGDSWDKTTEMGGNMPGTYKSTYTVTDIEGDMITLEESTKIQAKEGETMSITGTVTGTIVVDSRSGLVVKADQDMKMKASSGGKSFDINGKSKLKGKAR